MSGDNHLGAVEIINNKTGEVRTLDTPALFSFIGAVPRTEWLPPEIERDAKGFVRTGAALAQSPHWTARQSPFLLETSRPGVFAAGDVRSGSVKRVVSAVGEGAMAVQFVQVLQDHVNAGRIRTGSSPSRGWSSVQAERHDWYDFCCFYHEILRDTPHLVMRKRSWRSKEEKCYGIRGAQFTAPGNGSALR
jgi:hypothetical protein